jgi:BASS family bile acid:Na+ symporter
MLQQTINILVPLTLIVMMLAVGLAVDFFQTVRLLMNWRLVFRALAANYLCVPAITVLLMLIFRPNPYVAIGFLILAVCPGAPFGPPAVAIAKGNVTAGTALMLLLTSTSAIFAPLVLLPSISFLLPNSSTVISVPKIISSLIVTQLVPLGVGLAVRARRPTFAAKHLRAVNRTSAILTLAAVILIVSAQYQTLIAIRRRAFIAMTILLIATLLIGYVIAALGSDDRKAMTLSTSLRNIGVGLVIANGSFAGTPALNAVVAFGLFGVAGSILLAFAWAKWTPSHTLPRDLPTPPLAHRSP